MKLSDVIRPGDKLDIKLVNQIKREENGGNPAILYQSRVCDLTSETDLEIEMPMSGGKMVLFPVGAECYFVIYTQKGMYQCQAAVQRRYKEGNLFFLTVKLTKEPVKFQRREFFRIDCLLPLQFYKLTENMAKLETTEEIHEALKAGGENHLPCKGTTEDISGGGIRFSTDQMMENGEYLLVEFCLKNERMDEMFQLVSRVVNVVEHPNRKNMYIHRVKFIFRDMKVREKIVRYVFEEERRIRRKEVG